MDQPETNIANDVLHSENPTKLTPEEIAKALAHHNRHHGGENPEAATAASEPGKKSEPKKSK